MTGPEITLEESAATQRNELLRSLVSTSEPPTDELSLAAMLESRGVTDDVALERFGAQDVFALAGLLLEDWPRTAPESRRSVTGLEPRRPELVRAATYLVPAMFILLAHEVGVSNAPLLAFAAITCLGWGATQALARVAYASIGRGGAAAASRYLGTVLFAGSTLALLIAWTIGTGAGSAELGGVVGAQLGYLTLSVVVLPQRRDAVLVLALAPALVATAGVALGRVQPADAIVLALIGELAVAMIMALVLHQAGVARQGRPGSDDARDALPFLGTGIAAGAFLLGSTALGVATLGNAGLVVALAVSLTLCMGVAEIQIADVRRRIDDAMHDAGTVSEFSARARRVLGLHTAVFLVVLVIFEGAAFVLVEDLRTDAGVLVGLTMALVGLSLFLNLCLMIVEGVGPALLTFVGAGIVLWIVSSWGVPGVPDAEALMPVVAAAACLVLWMAVRVAVTHPVRHVFRR